MRSCEGALAVSTLSGVTIGYRGVEEATNNLIRESKRLYGDKACWRMLMVGHNTNNDNRDELEDVRMMVGDKMP